MQHKSKDRKNVSACTYISDGQRWGNQLRPLLAEVPSLAYGMLLLTCVGNHANQYMQPRQPAHDRKDKYIRNTASQQSKGEVKQAALHRKEKTKYATSIALYI